MVGCFGYSYDVIALTKIKFDTSVENALHEVLASGRLVQGPWVERFEREIAAVCHRTHGIAVSNGTAALQLALAALGVGAGDEVLCPDLSWPSPAHAIVLAGATPVLVDVDPYEWNAGPDAFKAAVTPRTKAAIVIDQFGNPARFAEIEAALPGVRLIEDAACALGSRRGLRPMGSFGAISCLSFHPRKILTTGEGGMCLTHDDALAHRLRVLRNHGQRNPGEFQEAAGNHRLSELAAALGVTQVAGLESQIVRRRQLRDAYREALPMLEWQREAPDATTNVQTLGALLPQTVHESTRKRFTTRARELGVELGTLSYAIHTLASVSRGGAAAAPCPHSAQIVRRGMSIPLYPDMTEQEQQNVISVIQTVWDEVMQ